MTRIAPLASSLACAAALAGMAVLLALPLAGPSRAEPARLVPSLLQPLR